MVESNDYLRKLDSIMGDGDLGLTMSKGFNKVCEDISDIDEKDVGKIFFKAGMILLNAAPSTMGTLLATGLMRAGKSAKGKKEINIENFSDMMSAFVEGIMERGKSKPGDKTIIGSLYPASEALKKASESNKNLKEGINEAYKASRNGLKKSKEMVAIHGRCAWHGEKSKGKEDPGAATGMLLIKAFYEYLK